MNAEVILLCPLNKNVSPIVPGVSMRIVLNVGWSAQDWINGSPTTNRKQETFRKIFIFPPICSRSCCPFLFPLFSCLFQSSRYLRRCKAEPSFLNLSMVSLWEKYELYFDIWHSACDMNKRFIDKWKYMNACENERKDWSRWSQIWRVK